MGAAQDFDPGQATAHQVFDTGADLRGRGVSNIDAVQHNARAVAFLTPDPNRRRFAVTPIHGHGDARLGVE